MLTIRKWIKRFINIILFRPICLGEWVRCENRQNCSKGLKWSWKCYCKQFKIYTKIMGY